jgi:hypothetical protein
MGLPDIVYLCGPRVGEELRYSLRSLVNLPHRRVWLAGYIPKWVRDVGAIPTKQKPGAKWVNQQANLLAAVTHPEVSERFVLFNDDFFVMRPIDEVPVMHRGPFAGLLDKYRQRRSEYARRITATCDLLGEEALCYDVIHTPLPMVKLQAKITVESMPDGLLFRSVYGNDWQVGGIEHADVKAHQKMPDGPFVSTSDQAFNTKQVGKHIRAAFPDPSPHE